MMYMAPLGRQRARQRRWEHLAGAWPRGGGSAQHLGARRPRGRLLRRSPVGWRRIQKGRRVSIRSLGRRRLAYVVERRTTRF